MSSRVLTFTGLEQECERITQSLEALLDPDLWVATQFEVENESAPSKTRELAWNVIVPDENSLRELHIYAEETDLTDEITENLKAALPQALAQRLQSSAVIDTDWIAKSLESLEPVRVGNIFVHGEHHANLAKSHEISLQIEASLAFGTGHHQTTRGCIRAYLKASKQRKFRRVLDVGTGSGILGFCAERLQNSTVIGTELDFSAIQTAKNNARKNKCPRMRFIHSPHLNRPAIRKSAPYDLIFANILQRPLLALCPQITGLLAKNGTLILSGLFGTDARAVIASYNARGLKLIAHTKDEGWSTLMMGR